MSEYRNEKWQLHRLDGPAWIHPNGTEYWVQDGDLHRLNGPAVIRHDKRLYWYVKGKNITREVSKWLKEQNITLPMSESEQTMFILKFVGK